MIIIFMDIIIMIAIITQRSHLIMGGWLNSITYNIISTLDNT